MRDRSVDCVLCSGILAGAFISLYKCAMINDLFFAQLYNWFGLNVGIGGEENRTSLSQPSIQALTQLKIPVNIAYGSQDIVADYCDLLPLYFIENDKSNFVIKRYSNLEYNFLPVQSDGQPDHSQGKWPEVLNSFVNWSISTKKDI